jgi:hypothetical protein
LEVAQRFRQQRQHKRIKQSHGFEQLNRRLLSYLHVLSLSATLFMAISHDSRAYGKFFYQLVYCSLTVEISQSPKRIPKIVNSPANCAKQQIPRLGFRVPWNIVVPIDL